MDRESPFLLRGEHFGLLLEFQWSISLRSSFSDRPLRCFLLPERVDLGVHLVGLLVQLVALPLFSLTWLLNSSLLVRYS